jgi:hypothetical protein
MQPIPDMGPALPRETREEIEANNRWWRQWFIAEVGASRMRTRPAAEMEADPASV